MVKAYEIKSAIGRVVNRECLYLPMKGLGGLDSKQVIGTVSYPPDDKSLNIFRSEDVLDNAILANAVVDI